ncbi:hypothetical protein [Gluconobacter kondonii]|uniref:Transposase n=1 Tax=Gluconobacter kondonii TaxID=941463 RepID=A0ABQ5WV01_9PROT|nr:hypothetical protein [Gluconobacter kondonii]GBR36678.1 hypothetical protein AA3266_2442 [Gluconobacter kondonii NBRC 3266]GLQ67376.1 hypothetical protein GCM10007870_29610 [Gluconobacter kondonii]
MNTDWIEKLDMLPVAARGRIRRYLEEGDGASMSTFYRALLSNDLIGAIQGADAENRAGLPDFVEYLTAYAPCGSYGSADAIQTWRGVASISSYPPE